MKKATFYAILAAALYAINIPVGKLLLGHVQPAMMAALLYLGAGLGLWLLGLVSKEPEKKEPLTKQELPYVLGMILLDIAAPILLMLGLERTGAANASLLNNFEIVATSLFAFFLFRERISRYLAVAISLVTLSGILLSFEGAGSFRFEAGSLLVLAAASCWGLENNCTRMLSGRSSVEVTTVKGIGSGLGSLAVAFAAGERLPRAVWIPAVLALGFVAYGLSINYYIKAQKDLGAAKTSAWYSVAPFLGVAFGMALGERPGLRFWLALGIMLLATVLMVRDTVTVQHTHVHTHTHSHPHSHGDLTHTHLHTHTHSHIHSHGSDAGVHDHDHRRSDDHAHTHEEEAP